MIRHLSTKIVPCTPRLIKEFATMPGCRMERQLKPARLRFLEARIKDRLFHPPKWAKSLWGGKWYRVNGQHSSRALLESDGLLPSALNAVIDEYACDTEMDLCNLFSQFDSAASVRNTADVIGAHASLHEQLAAVPRAIINRCISGIVFTEFEGAIGKCSPEERAGYVHDNVAFIMWAAEYVRGRNLSRAPIAAAMYLTYCRLDESATTFWQMVRDRNHPEVSHATRVLEKWLGESLNKRGTSGRQAVQWTPRAVFVKCIHAWNAFRNRRTTDLKYHPGSPIPRVI